MRFAYVCREEIQDKLVQEPKRVVFRDLDDPIHSTPFLPPRCRCLRSRIDELEAQRDMMRESCGAWEFKCNEITLQTEGVGW